VAANRTPTEGPKRTNYGPGGYLVYAGEKKSDANELYDKAVVI
jgi:hypothetical protein